LIGAFCPFRFREIGVMKGIMVTQMAAALALGSLAGARSQALAVTLYMTFFAAQWISCLGLYSLLMNEIPDAERSSASAMTMFSNALSGSAATALAGMLFTGFGYPRVMLGLAALGAGVSLLFRFLVPYSEKPAAGDAAGA
jgi:hypothetical protein